MAAFEETASTVEETVDETTKDTVGLGARWLTAADPEEEGTLCLNFVLLS